jgi:NhaP-type Na+/H+ or K+/H+ antiporter
MGTLSPLVLVAIGLLVFLAHLFSAIYDRKMVPDVLMLMIIGLIIGPVLGIVLPETFDVLGPVFTSITLVVILFEGGTTLSFSMLKSSWKSTMNLTFASFFAMIAVIATIAVQVFDFSVLSAIMLGTILGGTASPVVIPLVRMLVVGEETKTALILESALTDVLCIVVALACAQAFESGRINVTLAVGSIISSFVLASMVGILGAMLWSRVLARIRHIQNSIFTTPAFVFVIYGVSELLGFSGAMAALAFGITLANVDLFRGFLARKILGGMGHKLNHTEIVFLSELTFLLKTFFFVYIGLSIVFDNMLSMLYGILLTIAIFLARLMVARFASPTTAKNYDKSIVAIMAPKGLTAAILAAIPMQAGMPEGEMIKNIVYSVVLFSIITTSALIYFNNRPGGLRKFYGVFFGKDKSGN